jgi:hypothetical protein
MKLLVNLFLALGAIASAIVAPEQPSPLTHIIAFTGYDGKSNAEMILVSTKGEPIHPAPASGTSNSNNNDIAIPGWRSQLTGTPIPNLPPSDNPN